MGFGDKMAAKQQGRHRDNKPIKRIYRSKKDKVIAGVCGGIAEYFNIDPVIVRVIAVLLAFAWGFGILAYIVAWIIIPKNPNQ